MNNYKQAYTAPIQSSALAFSGEMLGKKWKVRRRNFPTDKHHKDLEFFPICRDSSVRKSG